MDKNKLILSGINQELRIIESRTKDIFKNHFDDINSSYLDLDYLIKELNKLNEHRKKLIKLKNEISPQFYSCDDIPF